MTRSTWIPRVLSATLIALGVTTIWAMTITGIFEQSDIQVDYFDTGAGNDLLLLRAILALAACGLSIVWACQHGSIMARLRRAAVGPCVLLLAAWSVVSLDRFAPGYSEKEFLAVQRAHLDGKILTLEDVRARLGSPLATAAGPEGGTIWSYSFTPSGGFGWQKRTLVFDSQGLLEQVSHFDEP